MPYAHEGLGSPQGILDQLFINSMQGPKNEMLLEPYGVRDTWVTPAMQGDKEAKKALL